MGDRVSIAFKNGKDTSVVLFSHWSGMRFVENANRYVGELKEWANSTNDKGPLSRLEPRMVMVDFIRHICKTDALGAARITEDYYFGCTPSDGDNSDNGHHVIGLGVDD